MQNFWIALVAAVSLTAASCKNGSGSECGQAIDHSLEVSRADLKAMGTDDAMLGKMRDLGVKRCTEDKWPTEATKCMTDAKSTADAQGCYGKLTPEQSEKMNKAAMELMPPRAGSADAH